MTITKIKQLINFLLKKEPEQTIKQEPNTTKPTKKHIQEQLSDIQEQADNIIKIICGIDKHDENQKILGFQHHVYGGAIRDILQGKSDQISDIDIYVQKLNMGYFTQDDKHQILRNNMLNIEHISKYFESVQFIDNSKHYYGYLNNYVETVIKISDPKLPYKIDLVFGSSDIEEFLNNAIDFNLCKVALDPHTQQPILTDEYKSDSLYKKITFDNAIFVKEGFLFSLHERLPKIQKKYPDFSFDYTTRSYEEAYQLNKDDQQLLKSELEFRKTKQTLETKIPKEKTNLNIRKQKI